MTKGRLEAFSDGVIAIIITIMVLELPMPHGPTLEDFDHAVPGLLNYLLSFIILGIYWANHHHLLHATERINGAILWANLHLLLWLSLVPFSTAYMYENHFAPLPTAAYGIVLIFAAAAYTILQACIIAYQGPGSRLAAAVGSDLKGKLSLALYLLALVVVWFYSYAAIALYIAVVVMWLVPDRRIESQLNK